jgi:hypothetical protein
MRSFGIAIPGTQIIFRFHEVISLEDPMTIVLRQPYSLGAR